MAQTLVIAVGDIMFTVKSDDADHQSGDVDHPML